MTDLDDFWDATSEPTGPELGPVFTATYESDSECCGETIEPGDQIRADGRGGWIHATNECESSFRPLQPRAASACPSCFCVHPGECA